MKDDGRTSRFHWVHPTLTFAREVLETGYRPLLGALLIVLAGWSWANRFVLDDAFISFRYASNLAAGEGLVWNPGERVEGYTNFLWTLLLAAPLSLGVDPLAFCFTAGPVLTAVTLFVSSRMAREVLESKPLALLTVGLLGTNPTFVAFSTGGLETQFLACLLTAIVWLALRTQRSKNLGTVRALALSLLAACALMTRLDAAVVVVPALLMATLSAWRGHPGSPRRRASLTALWVPAIVLIGAWFAWRIIYYASALPNSFHARQMGIQVWPHGLHYFLVFLTSYLLWPFAGLLLASLRRGIFWPSGGIPTLMLILSIQYAYIVNVGGDFMEFRFLVPTMPILFLLIVWVSFRWLARPLLGAGLVLLVLAGAVHHARSFIYYHNDIESIWNLTAHLVEPASDWIGVGSKLGRTFGSSPDLHIGVTAAGAIPYYSRLPAVDMLGISDAWITRHGIQIQGPAGHARFAPLAYLVQRRVNLVLGHPTLVRHSPPERTEYSFDDLRAHLVLADDSPEALPEEASVLEIPLDAWRAVVAVYLTPHHAVDAAITAERWRRFQISVSPADKDRES